MKAQTTITAGPMALNLWCNQKGIDPITAWRWRKKKWLETINICGRVYVTPEQIEEFTRRAQAGEFAKVHKHPPAPNSTN